MRGCMYALLLAGATSQLLDVRGHTAPPWTEEKDQPATAELIGQHAAPRQPAVAALASPPSAGTPAVSSSTSLPIEICKSAGLRSRCRSGQGELQKVVRWLDNGGSVDALCSAMTDDGQVTTATLLYSAAGIGHLRMVRMLLKRGASVDLPTSLGHTALVGAAWNGYTSILLELLQHRADPDEQDIEGSTALMMAADGGHEACVQALLRAEANPQLIDNNGRTALQWAEMKGHTAIAELIRQHAAPPQPATTSPSDAVLPLTWLWVVLSVVLGAIASVAFIRNFTAAGLGQHLAL